MRTNTTPATADHDLKALVDRIAKARNITQGAVAAELGIADKTLSRYITGKATVRPQILARLQQLDPDGASRVPPDQMEMD